MEAEHDKIEKTRLNRGYSVDDGDSYGSLSIEELKKDIGLDYAHSISRKKPGVFDWLSEGEVEHDGPSSFASPVSDPTPAAKPGHYDDDSNWGSW